MKKKITKKKAVTPKAALQKKKRKGSASVSLEAGKEIWPLERDVLFRPDRFKYVRKLIKPNGCVFCKSAEEGVGFKTLCLYQSKHAMVVLNKFPYNSGHILVIPKRHVADFDLLSKVEYQDLHQVLQLGVRVLRQTYQPAGFNVGLNLGAVAGAGIPEHLHYHIVPRWAGDLNFFPLIAETKTVIESLEMSFDRLVAYFNKL